MRTPRVCPICGEIHDATCYLYNGDFLPYINVAPGDSLNVILKNLNTIINNLTSSTTTTTSTFIPTGPFATLEITIPEGGITLDMYYQGDATFIHVNWGDGIIEDAPIGIGLVMGRYSHFYLEGVYIATFNTDYINWFSDAENATNVISLYRLTYLDLNASPITTLDVSGLILLQYLYLNDSFINQLGLDLILTTLTDSSFTVLNTINLQVQNDVHPTQSVIDTFVLAHPTCILLLNP